MSDMDEPRHGGRLPDPGMGAICGRCGEPRLAHGGLSHLGACPGETGVQAKRFSIALDDRPQPDIEPSWSPRGVAAVRAPEEIQAMIGSLDDNIREHGWDASVDAAYRALEWALGATWPDLDAYMARPDVDRRREWIARGGDPEYWPVAPPP